jgi:hypothetical protein
MKNIHLLPTEKPSRLTKPGGSSFIKLYTNGLTNTPKGHCKNYHLYITSDEEIKEGDWIKWGDAIYKANRKYIPPFKKIILTTDQDLIADGVQSIDDEFLEWFVKNPSCEEVKVKNVISKYFDCVRYIYKIIIPQEEPKQDEYTSQDFINEISWNKSEKETLEEAAKRTYQKGLQDDIDLSFYDGVRLGTQWQAAKMYSEEELKNAIEISVAKALGVMSFTINEESFEQFKKK